MVRRHTPFVVTFVLLIGAASAATAQHVSDDLVSAASQTRQGDVVHVTDARGEIFKWKLAEVPINELIAAAGLTENDVTTLSVERMDSAWNGALIGLAVSGAPWLLVCAANDWCYYNEYGAEHLLRATAITTTAIGAGLGALIDLSIRQRTTVFRAPTRSLLVSPHISGGSAAVRLFVAF